MVSVLRGPKFSLLAHTTLRLEDVQEGFKTHDLSLAAAGESPPSSSPFLFPFLPTPRSHASPTPPRGRRLLAAAVRQRVLPPGRSAFLHDPADHQWPLQGPGTLRRLFTSLNPPQHKPLTFSCCRSAGEGPSWLAECPRRPQGAEPLLLPHPS